MHPSSSTWTTPTLPFIPGPALPGRRSPINHTLCLIAAICFVFLAFVGGEHRAVAQAVDLPYPETRTKKGLQVEDVDDALQLGIDHAALNLNLAQLIDPSGQPENPTWTVQGETFSFRAGYLQQMDRRVASLSREGVLVNIILLAYLSEDPEINRILLHPEFSLDAPNRLGAFNNRSAEGKRWLTATIQFLANRWSGQQPELGRVCGWIVGNEVNSHWWWANMGPVTMEQFVADYSQVVRLVHSAVRSQSATSRIYVSLEHHWNIRFPAGNEKQAFPARDFLEHFAATIRQEGDFDWNVAFHPYPENLFDPKFWEDDSAPVDSQAARVTFRNLPVLLRFLQQPELTYRGQQRRVILSEQGFHSAPTAEGERLQAAAWCYAYHLVDQLEGIDAFILHRHIDHPQEGGLNLGLRRRVSDTAEDFEKQFPRKPIYDCFLKAGTAQQDAAFEFALPIIGIDSWPQIEDEKGSGPLKKK